VGMLLYVPANMTPPLQRIAKCRYDRSIPPSAP
jgi:hypothetical protein